MPDLVASRSPFIDGTFVKGAGEPFTITEALHTYFSVGAASAISIEGLAGQTYRDNTDGGRAKGTRSF